MQDEHKRKREDDGMKLLLEFDQGVQAVSVLMELCKKHRSLEGIGQALHDAETQLRAEDARHMTLTRLPKELILEIAGNLDPVSSVCFAMSCRDTRAIFSDASGIWLRRFLQAREMSDAKKIPTNALMWRARQAGFCGVRKVLELKDIDNAFQITVALSGSVTMFRAMSVPRHGAINHQMGMYKYDGISPPKVGKIVPLSFDPSYMTTYVRIKNNQATEQVAYVYGLHASSRTLIHIIHNFTTKEHTERRYQYVNIGGPKVRILPHNQSAYCIADNVSLTWSYPRQHLFCSEWSIGVRKQEVPSPDGTRSKKYEYNFTRYGFSWTTDALLQPIVLPPRCSGYLWAYYIHQGKLHYMNWAPLGTEEGTRLRTQEVPLPPSMKNVIAMGLAANKYTLFVVIKDVASSAFMNHYEMWARSLSDVTTRWWRITDRCAGCGDKQIMASSTGVTLGNKAYIFDVQPPQ